jgi:hypothetical protein
MQSGLISRASAVSAIADTYDIDNVAAELNQAAADQNERQPIE